MNCPVGVVPCPGTCDGGGYPGARECSQRPDVGHHRRNGAVMLTLTENAQTAIKSITDQAEIPDAGGVRIAMTDSGTELQMTIADQPETGDEVIEAGGARVFVPEETASVLESQEVDASQGPEGAGFSLRQQAGGSGRPSPPSGGPHPAG